MKYIVPVILLVAFLSAGCGHKDQAAANPVTLEGLNSDLSALVMRDGGRVPDTNQINAFLAAMGKSFPTAPPGKKIVLDPAARQFVVVDQ